MIGHDSTDVIRPDYVKESVHDLVLILDVKIACRFIEQHDLRFLCYGTCYLNHLIFPSGYLIYRFVGYRIQFHDIDDPPNQFQVPVRHIPPYVRFTTDENGFEDRASRDMGPLRYVPYGLCYLIPCMFFKILIIYENNAGSWRMDTIYAFQQCRLTSTVRTEN